MKNGFTLIELTIAVAIIAILASIAIPQYQNYLLRTHITTESSTARHEIEKAIVEFSSLYGSLPRSGFTDLQKVGFEQPSGLAHTNTSLVAKNIESIDWTGEKIVITFSKNHPQDRLSNQTLEVSAVSTSQNIQFLASGGSLPNHLIP